MFLKLNLRRGNSTVFFGKPEWSADGTVVSKDWVKTAIRGDRVCVLIHGYNVGNADKAYALIYNELMKRGWYQHVVGVWWPGSDLALAFWLASMRASKAGKVLAEESSGIYATIDIEAHSLGCKVALEALKNGAIVRNLILAAAAVDNESILEGEQYGDAVKRADSVVVCYSRSDGVLRGAYPLARLDNALGLTGPRPLGPEVPSNVCSYDLTDRVRSHGAYKESDAFYAVWGRFA